MAAPKRHANLTVASINRIKPPDRGARLELHDGKLQGLILRVTPAGVKTFSYVYSGRHPDGRRAHRRVTLNRWPADPAAQAAALGEARARAAQLQSQVASGQDPVREEAEHQEAEIAERLRRPPQRTVAWLAAEYIERGAKPAIKTWRSAERTLNNHWLPVIGDLPVQDVERKHLYDVLDGPGGPGQGGRRRQRPGRDHSALQLGAATRPGGQRAQRPPGA